MLKVKDLRISFTDFFRERGHRIIPSSSLLPKDDPTLLFTTAGMVQFKSMFAGTVNLEYTRAASVQKCLRTSDLENVGRTKRHLTLFEMLGNFSFGDYFKKEAVEFAWDYSTEVIGFPKEKIWVSIYQDDDEAFELWNKRIGVPAEKIVRLGKKDNFWGPAGDSGACGPCSELYLDRGDAYSCGSKDCRPGCDCERFLEFWNLVFNQYFQDTEGKLSPLPRTGIDTGMGLERLATLVQNVDSVYNTDEFINLSNFVVSAAGKKYEGKNIIPVNVIIEHARSLTFAMADGIYPSNEGRGYVLRRILRRALRYTRQLGINEPFIHRLIAPVTEMMGAFYPELRENPENISRIINGEETRFLETIENGMDRLEEVLKKGKVSGKDAFVLYDTFGFPVEMTVEIAGEKSISVDLKGFEKEMEEQKERGRRSWKGADAGLETSLELAASECGPAVFTGYDEDESAAELTAIFSGGGRADKLSAGESGIVVLNRTPFYGESGGQAGDRGIIISSSGDRFRVDDTKKINGVHLHTGFLEKGELMAKQKVTASLDRVRRNLVRANHSATHLLQASLRKVLGTHVKQAGSFVESDRLRFDFSHFSAMEESEISAVEEMVNGKIWENIGLETKKMKLDDAVKSGAMAVFDEKYEDEVRVISVGDFSRELCGGTHVLSTGQIGVFKILRESSPGAGLRRIEAVTLKGVLERFDSLSRIVSSLSRRMKISEDLLIKKYEDTMARLSALEKELGKSKKESISAGLESYISSAVRSGAVTIIQGVLENNSAEDLRAVSDEIRRRVDNAVVLLGSVSGDMAVIMFAATQKAVDAGIDCGKIVKETAGIIGGGGGGRRDMAQAGGKKPENLERAINAAVDIVKKITGGIPS